MIAQTVSNLLENQVSLDLEGIDRLYLNAYQPLLQTGGGVNYFFRGHRGAQVASTTLMAPMSRDFVKNIYNFAKAEDIEMLHFKKGERKDDITQRYLKENQQKDGVLYIGIAQEKFSTFRVTKKYNPITNAAFPWLSRSTVMCNQYYFYLIDDDFGPLFIKFSSYFPYTARININGHEYAKRQLEKKGIPFEALDNGILSCEQPTKVQEILDSLNEYKIEKMIRKWFKRLPHPFTPKDRKAGYRYELSILQSEFARTQVFKRPISGRYFFEEVIRENLDLGRPSQVSLIFNRRVTKRTPGKFSTRVITQGVMPSLHVSYKFSKIKQYFKEDKALRTETTINNTRDFGIGRLLKNLPKLRKVGFSANRRLLDIEKVSQDCQIGEEVFEEVTQPIVVDNQRVAALKFGDKRVISLMHAIGLFTIQPQGFSNASLRGAVAQLMGWKEKHYTQGKMSYDLRRLRLHDLIERIPHTHRYYVTSKGIRVSMFFNKVYSRIIQGGLSKLFDSFPEKENRPLVRAFDNLEKAIDEHIAYAKI